MAFANLFMGLTVDQDVTLSGDGKRKRKSQAEQRGPDNKKRGYKAQRSWPCNNKPFVGDESPAINYHLSNSEHSRTGFSEHSIHNHSGNSGHNSMHHKGQKAKKNHEQQNKQWDGRKHQQQHHHQKKNRGGSANGGGQYGTRFTSRKFGGQGKRGDGKQDFKVPATRLMTQEFKDQNALLVDGQLLCRHFIWGRCIKGDECQLKHIQGYNDIIKEACKYYIQGFCTKGESCPYMHKSFPCKFFHRKGHCSQKEDCKFSHDPLNETTSQLLEEVLKRDKDLYDLSKKAEQQSPGQPADTDEAEMTESKKVPYVTQPLRPIFYNSGEPTTEQDALLCKAEAQRDIPETAVPPGASGGGHPRSPLSTPLSHKEPVCYSVEAVLRPQLFKPFPSFYTTPGSQDPAPLSGPQNPPDSAPGSADQSKAPDSVDVVRSCKSESSLTRGLVFSPPPAAQSVSYAPKTGCEQRTDPLPNTRSEADKSQEKQFKCLPSFYTHSDLESKTCPDLTVAGGDDMKHVGEVAAPLKPAQRAFREVKSGVLYSPAAVAERPALSCRKVDVQRSTHLPVDTLHSVKCSPLATIKLKNQTYKSPRPWPHVSVLTSKSQATAKPLGPSSGFSTCKGGAAVPAEPVTSSAETTPPTKTCENSKQRQPTVDPGTQPPNSSEATAECSSSSGSGSVAHCGDSSFGCKKTFNSLFASTISDSLKLTPTTSSSLQLSSSAPLSTPCVSEDSHAETVVEPDKASARSFLCLFSAPLSAAPLPGKESRTDSSRAASRTRESNQLSDNATRPSDSNRRCSSAETSGLVEADGEQTSHRPTIPKFSPSSRNENQDDSSEAASQPAKQQVNPARRLVSVSSSRTPCGDKAESSTTRAHRRLPDISSPKGPAAAAASNSVLKSLFLCLSPFEEDGEKQDTAHTSLPSGSAKKEPSSTGDVLVETQRKRKKKRRKKKTQCSQQQSTKEGVADSTEHQPSSQTSLISLEATVGSTSGAPAATEPQVRNSGTHDLPFRPVTQLVQQHVRPRPKNSSGDGNVAVTPLRDLFKTLDTTGFNLGH